MKTKSDTFARNQFGMNAVLSKCTKVKKNQVMSTLNIPICIMKKIKNTQIKGVL